MTQPTLYKETADSDNTSDDVLSRKPIRSFVLRQGRMTQAQQRYLDGLMPEVGVPYQSSVIDLDTVFGRHTPKVLEIGFGMGETTAHIARHQPQTDFLCIEVHSPGVGNLCKLIDEFQLKNIRIIQHDAVEVLEQMLHPASLAGIHLFFPDPWHKKRHHKRRIMQTAFAALVAEKLQPGGYLHCATDWEEYAHWMLEVLNAQTGLENTAPDGFAPRPEYRPVTKFENRGVKLGHGVWDLLFIRA